MNGNRFDFAVKSLVAHAPRREAIKALAGSGLAAVAANFDIHDIFAGKKRKRRCRDRRARCGRKKKCCGHKIGLTACRQFPTANCTTLSGRFCCGLEGAVCSNDLAFNNCDCCDGLFCGGIPGEEGRCQEEPS
jgi:hypothetical protein